MAVTPGTAQAAPGAQNPAYRPASHYSRSRRERGAGQSKYLDNVVEQDHRTVERLVRPFMARSRLGFSRFAHAQRAAIAGTLEQHRPSCLGLASYSGWMLASCAPGSWP